MQMKIKYFSEQEIFLSTCKLEACPGPCTKESALACLLKSKSRILINPVIIMVTVIVIFIMLTWMRGGLQVCICKSTSSWSSTSWSTSSTTSSSLSCLRGWEDVGVHLQVNIVIMMMIMTMMMIIILPTWMGGCGCAVARNCSFLPGNRHHFVLRHWKYLMIFMIFMMMIDDNNDWWSCF